MATIFFDKVRFSGKSVLRVFFSGQTGVAFHQIDDGGWRSKALSDRLVVRFVLVWHGSCKISRKKSIVSSFQFCLQARPTFRQSVFWLDRKVMEKNTIFWKRKFQIKMSSPKEFSTALRIIIVLLAVGGIAYAAFPTVAPEEPIRIVYKGSAGNVVFTHGVHASGDGYGADCLSCHHNIEEDDVYDCRQCHGDDGDEDLPGMTDALHTQCIQCHEDQGAGPVECAACHRSR